MTYRAIKAAATFLVLAAVSVSCAREEWQNIQPVGNEGYVTLNFSTNTPAMEEVTTRAVDPDGGGVQDMTLFCFDGYGLFITTVSAQLSTAGMVGAMEGSFTAQVPENTRTVHFVANQNMTGFSEDYFRNRSESEVMALLEGSSGRMIYWARFACDPSNDAGIKDQLSAAGNKVTLIRNHAQIEVADPSGNGHFVVTGFAVSNINAFGTVAPYHPEKGFDFVWPSDEDPFVTLPENKAKMSDVSDVTTNTRQYVFESENRSDDPVSVILRGHPAGQTEADDLYYRIMLVDDEGEQLLIRRNHKYIVNISGALSFGQQTFAEALTAPATNNVWISISDDVNSVEDQDYILAVEQTAYILSEKDAGRQYSLTYTVSGKGGTTIADSDKAEVSWIENGVAQQGIGHSFAVDGNNVGTGTITVSLLPMGSNEKLEGTLLVKKGRLQRRIKIITIKEQTFVPSWVGTEVYGSTEDGRAHVTAMFTIPESCPEELFPMNVYLSVSDLDIRNASGMVLPVVFDGDEEWYSSGEIDPEPGYKFVYTADGPGVHRIYFENILDQVEGYTGTLYIEAEHFSTMKRDFRFSDSRLSITVQGLSEYTSGTGPADEAIYYRLVPQKKGANVQFDMLMAERSENDQESGIANPQNAGVKDEFLLYSQFLDYYLDGEESSAGVENFDCTFFPDESEVWWTANNPQGGRMLMFKPRDEVRDNPPKGEGTYSIYMKTNRAKSAEVIRIASNNSRYAPVLPADADDANPGIYGGGSYRSTTFELANYNPFRFAARVDYGGSGWMGDAEELNTSDRTAGLPEKVTSLEWTYRPDMTVDIALDVTSFAGTDGNSVDPFGQKFEIYIDAPMLTIDESRLAACNLTPDKLRADTEVPGRFIYTVDASRENERTFGTGPALVTDTTPNLAAGTQAGERKTLPFLVSTSVSAGDIVISSNEDQVVYYSKTFKVSNSPITGSLVYEVNGVRTPVPEDAFVSFERLRNNSRIGSVTVIADGSYELALRGEYEFNWYADPIELRYTADDGKEYHAGYDSLSDLFGAPDIVLIP